MKKIILPTAFITILLGTYLTFLQFFTFRQIPTRGTNIEGMSPTLNPGDHIIVRKSQKDMNIKDIHINDILLISPQKGFFEQEWLGRVKSITDQGFIVKGDGLTELENTITKDQIIGKVYYRYKKCTSQCNFVFEQVK